MRILYVFGEIQQVAQIAYALDQIGHEVAVYPKSLQKIEESNENKDAFYSFLDRSALDFVISSTFDAYVAEVTHDLNLRYVVYGMDSPMFATYRYAKEARYENCYLFYFDHREYERLKAKGYSNVYYMPLGSDDFTSGNLSVSDEEIEKYKCDISFVGSLYSNNAYDEHIEKFAQPVREKLTEILENCALCWDGEDRLTPQLTPELVKEIGSRFLDIQKRNFQMSDMDYVKYLIFCRKLTHIERTLLLELLAEYYDLRLYTWDNQIVSERIRHFPQVESDESFKIFYSSKINLNITLRSIESGIPLRVFDIMSVGGFVLSNWQPEIPELFEEGKEIVTFRTPEEMLDKVEYYLKHEMERQRIALNGYRKVKNCHTLEHRLAKIISIIQGRK